MIKTGRFMQIGVAVMRDPITGEPKNNSIAIYAEVRKDFSGDDDTILGDSIDRDIVQIFADKYKEVLKAERNEQL